MLVARPVSEVGFGQKFGAVSVTEETDDPLEVNVDMACIDSLVLVSGH